MPRVHVCRKHDARVPHCRCGARAIGTRLRLSCMCSAHAWSLLEDEPLAAQLHRERLHEALSIAGVRARPGGQLGFVLVVGHALDGV